MVTVAIRVTKLTAQPDTGAPFGRSWQISFASGTQVTLAVTDGPFGVTTNLPAKATLDMQRNQVRISATVRAIKTIWPTAQLTPRRSLFSGITATAQGVIQAPGSNVTNQQSLAGYGFTYNQAISPRTYLAGTPSCLKVGS
jgi:hypothetical protein